MSATLTITEKGEVTLDQELLDHLGVKPGGTLAVDLDPAGRLSLQAAKGDDAPHAERRPGRIEDTFGMLNHLAKGPAPTIEEMNEIIADCWAGKR